MNIFIGKEGEDDSYIEFGKYNGTNKNITFIQTQPLTKEGQLEMWSTEFTQAMIGYGPLAFGSN
jgi:hypothetical protein